MNAGADFGARSGDHLDRAYEALNISVWHLLRRARPARVLDVGCGTGALGAVLVGGGAHVEGITWSEREAVMARRSLHAVHVIDLNDPSAIAAMLADTVSTVESHGSGSFDTVVLSNVLEHLVDPATTLRAFDPLWDAGASAYVSLPNVACWFVRFGLLAGRFTPTDEGILDRTHLHHYTKRTALDLLESVGLDVEAVDVMPSITVWLYGKVKRRSRHRRPLANSTGELSRPRGSQRSFRLYERLIYPIERAITRLWPGMLAHEFTFVCRRSDQVVTNPEAL